MNENAKRFFAAEDLESPAMVGQLTEAGGNSVSVFLNECRNRRDSRKDSP